VGAIVVRYVYVQQDLANKNEALGVSEHALALKNKKLQALRKQLQEQVDKLAKERQEREHIAQRLTLQQTEVEKLKALLLEYDEKEESYLQKLSGMQNELNTTRQTLLQKEVFSEELENNLSQMQNVMHLKEDEIALLTKKLLAQSLQHQQLVEELNITKVKIKNLTGIRMKVVSTLKERLGESIEIDPKSGAMRFASNILFNQGAYKLKSGAKKELKAFLQKYIHTLLLDPEIRSYIEGITIEGHTDSVGDYLYNLALSQKRALEVMKFLYKSDKKNRDLYARYLSASGRSYSDLIYDKNGKEDKEASRRIEIKFRIKNEKAIKELEKFLNRKESKDEKR
jgi:chemotaxis protein MotB